MQLNFSKCLAYLHGWVIEMGGVIMKKAKKMQKTENFSVWRKVMKNKILHPVWLLFLAFIPAIITGCQETRPERNYVQANVYDKSVFQGEWYYVRTVVDHDYESSWMGYYGTFVGDQTWSTALGSIERVTWIIDENYIYAYRTVPVVDGADSRQNNPNFREDPVAAFRIIDHFDIIKRYNPVTGEELNVREETKNERPWYERKYMRVDWSQNLLTAYYWNSLDAYESFGYIQKESVPFYCAEGTDLGYQVEGSCKDGMDNDFDGTCDVSGCEVTITQGNEKIKRTLPPDPKCVENPDASEIQVASACKPEWKPVIRNTSCAFDEAYGTYYVEEVEGGTCPRNNDTGIPYYFSFVTQEMWTPNPEWIWMQVGFGNFPVTSVKVTIRNSFLKTPIKSHYEPLNVVDRMWDRFGIIRMAQQVYMGGEGSNYDPNDPEKNDPDDIIKQDRGYVDFLNYWGARHNIWKDYKDEDGNVIPYNQRQVRKIVYYLNQGFPKWLIPTAFEVMEEWNSALMDAVSIAQTGRKKGEYDCQVKYGDYSKEEVPEQILPKNPSSFSAYNGLLNGPDSTPRFVGNDCVLVLRVNSYDLPEGVYEDSAGRREIHRDSETGMIIAQRSNVDPYGEQMGDLRFKFMSVIDTPGAMFSGVSLPMQDPKTGELIQSNFNITRESYEWTMTDAIIALGLYSDLCKSDSMDFHDSGVNDTYKSICTYLESVMNDISLPEYMNGEYIREYFANLGKVTLPVSPIVPEALSGAPVGPGGFALKSQLSQIARDTLEERIKRLEPLMREDGRAMLKTDRIFRLKGTEFEKLLYDNPESYVLYSNTGMPVGPNIDPSGPVPENILDQISIMRKSMPEQFYAQKRRYMRMLDHFMEPSNPFIDYSMIEVAQRFKDAGYDANQIAMKVGQMFFKAVMLHEAGHSIGMEHNFAASIDMNNYHDEYFEITHPRECMTASCPVGGTTEERERNNCWPCPDNVTFPDYNLTVDQSYEWSKEVDRMERKREMLGIRRWETSSVMDYLAEFPDELALRLGKFDRAFAIFSYAGRVEAYQGDPRVEGSKFILDPRNLGREYWVYYLGGETCNQDSDCPFSADKTGKLPESQILAGVTQRCVPSTIYKDLSIKHCSEFYDDATKFITEVGPQRQQYYPVIYRFCSNNRTYDISWCNMFDQGASYREIVKNLVRFFNKYYPYSHFRRYQRLPNVGTYWFPFEIMGKINQHLLYRYFYEPEFQSVSGPTGFDDMYLAVLDSVNFFAQILATPDVGSYKYAPESNTYYKFDDELGRGDLDIPLGMGKYMWSANQDGQFGIFEIERAGFLYDKLYALMAMLMREWGATYYYDERFWFNYYDIFAPNEVMELLATLILDEPTYYGARWFTDPDTGERTLMYPQIYAPNMCTDIGTNPQAEWLDCNSSRAPYYFPRSWEQIDPSIPKVASYSNDIIRNYAVIISLAELPYFLDPTYERQLFICERGSGYCFDICEQPAVDGGTAYYFCNDPEVKPLIPGEDFVTYTSQRLHKTFQAVQVEKRAPYEVKQVDIAMDLLKKANRLQDTYVDYMRHKDAGTCPPGFTPPCDQSLSEAIERVSSELIRTESFIVNIINIQRLYGISSWLI